jgi:hypothetical protein
MKSAVVVVVVVAFCSRPADACEQIAGPAFDFATFPVDGTTDVAVNVTPFLSAVDALGVLRVNPRLRVKDGADVEVVSSLTQVTAFFSSTALLRLAPITPLAPTTTHELVDDAGVITTFVTGATSDDAEPNAPAVEVTDLVAPDPDSTGFQCSFSGVGSLVIDAEPGAMLIASTEGDVDLDAPLNAASLTDTISILAQEPVTASVAAVDVAGHISAPTEVAIEIPPPVGCLGCQATGAPLPVIGLLLLRRRRSAR